MPTAITAPDMATLGGSPLSALTVPVGSSRPIRRALSGPSVLGLPVLALVLAALVLATAPEARAQAADSDIAKATQLNKKAIEEYENLNFDQARTLLKQALDVCTSAGLDSHPIKARTHLNLGVVTLAGFKDRDAAVKHFKKALEIQPDIKVSAMLANPEIQEAFDEAAAQVQAEKPVTPPPPKPTETTSPAEMLSHESIGTAPSGSAITVTVIPDKELSFKRIVLGYKPEGARSFLARQMREAAGGIYVADIPATGTAGRSVAYYIEAQDEDGKSVASRGSAADPMQVVLTGGGKKKKVVVEAASDGPRLHIGFMGGSGVGWMSGTGETNPNDRVDPPGFAWARVGHIAPEIGYFVSPRLMLGLQGRWQFISGATPYAPGNGADECGADGVCSPAKGAIAVLAKATYFFAEEGLRPFASIAFGGGNIRHVAAFPAHEECGSSTSEVCVDSVAAGPVLAGPGFGLNYALSETFSLVAALDTLVAFGHFSFNFDLNVGAAVEF